MHTVARCIGVCGVIGSGKSYGAQVLSTEYGFNHISADEVFRNYVRGDGGYRRAFIDFWKKRGVDPEAPGMDSHELLFGDHQARNGFHTLKAMNVFNRDFMRPALELLISTSSTPCVLEMATLPASAYSDLAEVIVRVRAHDESGEAHFASVIRRDPFRRHNITRNMIEYQIEVLDVFNDDVVVLDNWKHDPDAESGIRRLTVAELLESAKSVLPSTIFSKETP